LTVKKITLTKKIALVLLGISLGLFLVELSLRLAGAAYLSAQQQRNMAALKARGACRVLCLGESTTTLQYPRFLEEFLNKNTGGIRFSVIDKGVPGTDTDLILVDLKRNLDACEPDIVVVMMGINDPRPFNGPGFSVGTLERFFGPARYFFNNCRTVKLIRRLVTRAPSRQRLLADIRHAGRDAVTPRSAGNTVTDFVLLSRDYLMCPPVGMGRRSPLEAYKDKIHPVFMRREALESGLPVPHAGSIPEMRCLSGGDGKEAERSARLLITLGCSYKNDRDYRSARKCFARAVELNPRDPRAFWELANVSGGSKEGQDAARKAVELDPGDWKMCLEVSHYFHIQKLPEEAEKYYGRAVELAGEEAVYGMMWLIPRQRIATSQKTLRARAAGPSPGLYEPVAALAGLCRDTGQVALCGQYEKKLKKLAMSGYYTRHTVWNFRRMERILRQRNIRMVCVQYPVRPVQPLRDIFRDVDGVIFVDNEKTFKDVLKPGMYTAYFQDMFGGDFGHCTDAGNRLLGENIGKAVLGMVEGK
jgi:Tfp pilus assembly protein PilF